jgi:hypothetical protein
MPPPLPTASDWSQGVEAILTPRSDERESNNEFFSSLAGGRVQTRTRTPAIQTRAAFSDLFDFGFTRFITPGWVKVVYNVAFLLSVALLILFAVAIVYLWSQRPADSGPIVTFGIVGGLLLLLILACWLFLLRLALEAILVVFRIEEHGRSIRRMVAGYIARIDAVDKQSQQP